FAQGRLSYSQVRAITRIATPKNETTILDVALVATGAQLERICHGYRRASGWEKEAAMDRRLRARPLGDGLVKLEIVISTDEADLLMKAIDRVREQLTTSAERDAQPATSRARAGSQAAAAAAPRPAAADALVHVANLVLA